MSWACLYKPQGVLAYTGHTGVAYNGHNGVANNGHKAGLPLMAEAWVAYKGHNRVVYKPGLPILAIRRGCVFGHNGIANNNHTGVAYNGQKLGMPKLAISWGCLIRLGTGAGGQGHYLPHRNPEQAGGPHPPSQLQYPVGCRRDLVPQHCSGGVPAPPPSPASGPVSRAMRACDQTLALLQHTPTPSMCAEASACACTRVPQRVWLCGLLNVRL